MMVCIIVAGRRNFLQSLRSNSQCSLVVLCWKRALSTLANWVWDKAWTVDTFRVPDLQDILHDI